MTVTYHAELVQGSEEWAAIRCGLITASEMKLIVPPPPKVETRIKKNGEPYKQREFTPSDNEKKTAHLYELLAQRITGYVEPQYVSDDMLRGQEDEIEARALYARHHAPVQEVGFITNDEWGFTLGYSPDGLVGEEGLIEAKSRRAKYQVQTIVENVGNDSGLTIPAEYVLQCQSGMLVSGRTWLDFISYSGGLPAAIMRVHPIAVVQNAIVEAAGEFERQIARALATYRETASRLISTERRVEMEMHL